MKESINQKEETEQWLEENNFNVEYSFPTVGKAALILSHGTNLVLNTGKISLKKIQGYDYDRIREICTEYLREYKIESLLKDEIRNDKINDLGI